MNTFSQLPAVKMYSKNGAAGKIFGPSYFDPTLVISKMLLKFLTLNLEFEKVFLGHNLFSQYVKTIFETKYRNFANVLPFDNGLCVVFLGLRN